MAVEHAYRLVITIVDSWKIDGNGKQIGKRT